MGRNILRRSKPTQKLESLYKMLSRAFISIRMMSYDDASIKQSGQLADALHDLPVYMISGELEWEWVLGDLRNYEQDYPMSKGFADSFQKIIEMEKG